MNNFYPTLYKFDVSGKIRVWYMEQDGSRYRTVAGIKDGNLVESGWRQAEATNVGRKNERDPVAQATFEIESEYKKNLKHDYHKTIEGARAGDHFYGPMLAEKYRPKKFEKGYGQPKLDGIRCIAKRDGLWSRTGEPILAGPHILELLKPLFEENPNLIIDGELYNHLLNDDFNAICSAVKKWKNATPEEKAAAIKVLQFHVYDLPSHPGNFGERTKALKALVKKINSPIIVYVETVWLETTQEFDAFHKKCLAAFYEGSIYRLDAPYEQRRTWALQKRKEFIDKEFEISRLIEGKGNWAGCAKAVEFIMPNDHRRKNGERPKAGIKGSKEFCKELLEHQDEYHLATITYFALTPDRVPRLGVATKFHGKKRKY